VKPHVFGELPRGKLPVRTSTDEQGES